MRLRSIVPMLIAASATACTVAVAGEPPPMAIVAAAAVDDPSGERPRAGECRRDGSPPVKERLFDAQPAVPCDQPHGLETWKVADLPERWQAVRHLPLADGPLEQELDQALDALCPRAELDAFLGLPVRAEPLGTRHQPTPVTSFRFTPTPEQWRHGARWVRCDAGYIGDRDLTVGLSAARNGRSNPRSEATAALCVDPDGYRDLCTEPHVYEIVATFADVTTGSPSRSADPRATETWSERCWAAIREMVGTGGARPIDLPDEAILVVYAPVASAWAGGEHWVQCWLGYRPEPDLDELREWTGTMRFKGAEVPEVLR